MLELVRVAALATDNSVERKVRQEECGNRLLGVRLNSRSRSVELVDIDPTSGQAMKINLLTGSGRWSFISKKVS